MPKINTQYVRGLTLNPLDATSPNIIWTVTDGDIISGQGTTTLIQTFTSLGNCIISVSATNGCSVVNNSHIYNVCENITGFIQGPTGVLAPVGMQQNVETYTFTPNTGTPLTYLWSVVSGDATIIGANDIDFVDLAIGNSTGSITLSCIVSDCDSINTEFTTSITVTTNCIPLMSCDFI